MRVRSRGWRRLEEAGHRRRIAHELARTGASGLAEREVSAQEVPDLRGGWGLRSRCVGINSRDDELLPTWSERTGQATHGKRRRADGG